MNADPKLAAYYAGVSEHTFDGGGAGTLVTGVALAYAIVVLALVAKLVFSSDTPTWTAPEPAIPHATSVAIDPGAPAVGAPARPAGA